MSHAPEQSSDPWEGAWPSDPTAPDAQPLQLDERQTAEVLEAIEQAVQEGELVEGDRSTEEGLLFDQLILHSMASLGMPRNAASIGLERLANGVDKTLETAGKYKIMLMLGAVVLGAAGDIVFDPGGAVKANALPWAAYVVGEGGWCATMWVAGKAVGERMSLNPLKIHDFIAKLSDASIAQAAKGNTKFKVWFLANRGVAALQGAIPMALIFATSPPQGYPSLLYFAFDLAATGVIGKTIWDAAYPKEAEDNSSE